MFEKYVINEEVFQNKGEITERCRSIIASNVGNNLSGSDLEFMIQILKFHPSPDKLMCTKRIFVSIDNHYKKNHCLYIEYLNGRIDDASWTKSVLHIPFGEKYQIEWKMRFGKHKDKSLYDIYEEDKEYLQWLSRQEWVDRGLKVKINQMLRYGHIPYNPIAHKHELEKKGMINVSHFPVEEIPYQMNDVSNSVDPDDYFGDPDDYE